MAEDENPRQAEGGLPDRLRGRASLEYPFAPPAADGSVVEVAPGVLWLRQPMPMSLDHINVYLLRDGDGWTLVDTGLNTQQSRDLWEQIIATRLGGLPLKRLICTHNHYDQSWSTLISSRASAYGGNTKFSLMDACLIHLHKDPILQLRC